MERSLPSSMPVLDKPGVSMQGFWEDASICILNEGRWGVFGAKRDQSGSWSVISVETSSPEWVGSWFGDTICRLQSLCWCWLVVDTPQFSLPMA